MTLERMSREDLERLFEERKAALIAVRNEIDRRDRIAGRKGVRVEFTDYVGDGIEDGL